MCTPSPEQAVIDAAVKLANLYKIGNRVDRIIPEARRLVAAVDEYRDPERRETREP